MTPPNATARALLKILLTRFAFVRHDGETFGVLADSSGFRERPIASEFFEDAARVELRAVAGDDFDEAAFQDILQRLRGLPFDALGDYEQPRVVRRAVAAIRKVAADVKAGKLGAPALFLLGFELRAALDAANTQRE